VSSIEGGSLGRKIQRHGVKTSTSGAPVGAGACQ
jgi:hypothetical protein